MVNGVVIIDKPKGPTSHSVVQKVKSLFKAGKAGHTGTLDPLATGVLPICLGRATKQAGQFMSGDKEYEVTELNIFKAIEAICNLVISRDTLEILK